MLIGFREDPAFGPVLTVSKGGDDAEFFAAHYDPANLFLPPMEYDEALAFTRSLHIRHKFEQIGHPEYLEHDGARHGASSAPSPCAYSPMAEKPRWVFKALEVNPFAISTDGRFVALDGLAEFAAPPPAEEWNPRVNLRKPGRVLPAPRASRWSGSPPTSPSTAWRATSPSCCTNCTATTCSS